MKIISLIFLLLISISLTSAISIFAGESYELELEKPYDYYSVAGNTSEVILNITPNGNGNNVTIIPDKYSLNDSYEVIFFDIEKEVIVQYSGGGGGSRTVYKDKEINNYIDRPVIEYQDKEVPGEINEVEKIINKTPLWCWVVLFLFVCLLIFMFTEYLRSEENLERRYENNE